MQYQFGTGTLWAAATMDALGNTIANPTPAKFGTLGDVGIDMSRDIKELYGQLALPVALGGGKMKIEIKAKFAQIAGRLFNDFFLGQGMTAGTLTGAVEDLTGVAIPSTPFQITPTVPGAGTWLRDLGVLDANGVPMQRVASGPTTGQYSVTAGVYLFATADVGKIVYISFTYTSSLASAKNVAFNNIAMGTVPVFGIDLACKYQGKQAYFRFGQCTSKKISFGPKQDDFTMMDIDISAYADPVTNAVGSIVFTE
jgi:hypothetical protein